MKPAEILFFVGCIAVAAIVAFFVLPGSDLRLAEIAVIKVFYLAMLNGIVAAILVCLRGVKTDILAMFLAEPAALALFLGFWILANANVIAK